MKKRLIFLSSSILTLLILGSIATQSPTQEAPTGETTPEVAPTDVSEEELQQFAQAVSQLQTIQQQYEQEMVQAVESEGLSKERFIEIRQIQLSPEVGENAEISEEEMQSFERADNRLADIQQEATTTMKDAIQSEGLEVQRFNQIMAAVQQSPELQQQIQNFTN